MAERALVSIILPTFNSAAYLKDAIGSILSQTYRPWELIVVDDGSTDGTRPYLESLDHRDIRLIASAHTGNPGRARNLALTSARGRYLAFLDSDDWWECDKLAVQYETLTRHPECRWCYTALRGVADDGREIELFDRRGFVPHDGWILERLAAGGVAVTTSTVMAERALVEEVGGFDERLTIAEDLDLWMRLAQQSPIAVVPRILATRRVHDGSYSAPYRDRFSELNDAFRKMTMKAPSRRVRRLLRRRRKTWLLRLAGRQRRAGAYGPARRTLAAALPGALASPRWWAAVLKALLQPFLARFRKRAPMTPAPGVDH
jgi:glycosyltransferase involved in cell wall biosynthesis